MSSRARSTSRNARPGSANANKQGNKAPQPRNVVPQNEVKKRVGNYVIGNTVGEGTFGKVKCAIHIPTGEKVAVKILEKKRIQEQADVRRVNREIKILKKARHGNIIQLFEVLDTPNSIYLIMENADGGEMFDYIVKHRHVNEKQACKFFHQIIQGVEELHKNEITHRDLKPENLLLKASAQGWLIKIVDFGLSNTHDGGRLLSTACGSPCYAAPEMIAGKKYKGPGADTWSLGVILFALVCGYLPFEDPNTSNLYRKILSGEYKTPKWISPEVKDLIRKILETKPERRLTIAKIREHPWMRSVPLETVPKDEPFDDEEAKQVKNIVTQRLTEEKMDVSAVLDAVSSHACNALSALYYLMTQKELAKYRERKKKVNTGEESVEYLKNIPSNRTEISQASSSKPESSSTEKPYNQHNQHHKQTSATPSSSLAPMANQSAANTNHPNSRTKKESTTATVTDPSRMVPLVSPDRVHNPTEPVVLKKIPDQSNRIPRLDLGKTQELRIEGTLQSQTARTPNQNSPKTVVAPIADSGGAGGSLSARPVLYEASPLSNKENNTHTENHVKQEEEEAMGGTLEDFFPKDLSPDKSDQLNPNNNINEDDPTEERPTTRRSRSRRGDSACGNFNGDGPGAGRIEYEDTKKLTDRPMEPTTNSVPTQHTPMALQPMMPSHPQRSANVSSRGTNRRGRNISQAEQHLNPNNKTAAPTTIIPLNAHVTQMAPIGRPPSGSSSRSGSRNASYRQQKLQQQQHQQHQPNSSGSSAREVASKNKQRQSGGYNIISGGRTTKTGVV